jgi:hypothetical protein
MRERFEESVTVKFRGEGDAELTASALLQRDPQFLKPNRILILGAHDVMIQATSLQGRGEIQWEVHNRSDWPGGNSVDYRRSGAGFVRTTGMTQGVSIADESIQPVAEVSVHEVVECFRDKAGNKQVAEYWFMQRPRYWPVHPPPLRDFERRRVTERWIRISSANLRFRLISLA